jgi:protein gp37
VRSTKLRSPGNGPGARPLNLDWVRELRDRRGETAFYVKQMGGRTPKSGGRPEMRSAVGRLVNASRDGS